MTSEARQVFTIVCDSCGQRHHKPDDRSVHEARVSAGVQGWGWRAGKARAHDPAAKPSLDWCPDCSEELALKVKHSSGD